MTHVLVALAVLAAGSRQSTQVFRSGVDAVQVDVLVTDGRRPVAGLTAADFELLDSGVQQRLSALATADVPIAMLLALDTSTSVEGSTLRHLKEGAQAAIQTLVPPDRAALLIFANDVRVQARWGSRAAPLLAGLAAARAGGSTSLYDAAFTALLLRDEVPGHRSMVVLFSDGADTASWLPARAVLDKAQRTDSVVYSVVMSARGGRDFEWKLQRRSGIELSPPPVGSIARGTPFLEELADITGGDTFRTERTGDLRDAFTRIVTQFRSRYLLTYTPEGVASGGWHPIEVKLKDKKGHVRARRGYSR